MNLNKILVKKVEFPYRQRTSKKVILYDKSLLCGVNGPDFLKIRLILDLLWNVFFTGIY